MRLHQNIDKTLVWILGALLVIGTVMFVSGALSLLAKDTGHFIRTLMGHLGLGLGGGALAWIIITGTPLQFWYKWSPYFFFASVVLTLMVFAPVIGMSHGGATRWISIGGFSFQPAEFMKITIILYSARLLTDAGHLVKNLWGGLLPLVGVIGLVGGVMLAQPDTDTFMAMALGVGALMLLAGVPYKQLISLALVGMFVMGGVVMARPYLRERLTSFVNPAADPLGASYQLQQSIMAIGSGSVFGRGLGQSVQKFGYLPEPMGDSIFAVLGEEFGFLGTSVVVILYFALLIRCFQIALKSREDYNRLIVAGIGILFAVQSLLNMVSNLGLFPFSGLPLVFMSQGGTALLTAIIGYALVARASIELPVITRKQS